MKPASISASWKPTPSELSKRKFDWKQTWWPDMNLICSKLFVPFLTKNFADYNDLLEKKVTWHQPSPIMGTCQFCFKRLSKVGCMKWMVTWVSAPPIVGQLQKFRLWRWTCLPRHLTETAARKYEEDEGRRERARNRNAAVVTRTWPRTAQSASFLDSPTVNKLSAF